MGVVEEEEKMEREIVKGVEIGNDVNKGGKGGEREREGLRDE